MRRTLQLFGLAAVLGILAPSLASLRPEYGGTLRMAIFEPAEIDPARLPLPTDGTLSGLIYETLLVPGPTGTLAPGLAVDWKLAEDGLSLTCHLASARFSDGAPVTAAAVLGSLAQLRSTDQAWLVSNFDLDAAQALPEVLELRLRTPDPMAPFLLAHPATAIARRAGGTILGTGPFTVASISADRQQVVLGQNLYHRDGPPYLDSVKATHFETAEDALRELERGHLDLAPVPIDQADRLAGGAPGLKLHTLENIETVALLLHPARFGGQHKDWIRDHLDLDSMASFRLRSHGALARSFDARLTPYSPASSAGTPARGSAPDLSRPMRLVFPGYLPLAHQLAARIRGDLQSQAARVEVEPVSQSELAVRLGRKDYDLALVLVHSLGSPPLTLLDWSRTLRLPPPRISERLSSWLLADESLRSQPSVLPLFQTQLHYGAQARLVDLAWTSDARPTLEQTWWRPRLDIPEK